jgi:hypothetical protein
MVEEPERSLNENVSLPLISKITSVDLRETLRAG